MADPSVKMQFFGNAADAERAIVKLEQKYDKLEGRMKGMSRTSRKTTGGMVAGFVKAQLSVAALTGALRSALQFQMQMRQEAEATAIALDRSARKFQIQAGLSNLESAVAQKRVGEIAAQTGYSQSALNRIATQATSVGFQGDLLKKGGLVEGIVAFAQATKQLKGDEVDVEALVSGIQQEVQSGGKKLTSRNAMGVLLRVQGLFTKTPLEAADLPEFSKARKVAAAPAINMSEETFLSAAAIMKQSMNAAEASTGFKNVMLRLSAPEKAAQKEMNRVLGRIGMNREDVDLVGEDLPEALRRLQKGVSNLPAEEQMPALKQFFGQKVAVAGLALMQGAREGQFEKFAGLQANPPGFEAGVRVARSGLSASLEKGKATLSELQREVIEAGGITSEEALQQLTIESMRRKKRSRGLLDDTGHLIWDTADLPARWLLRAGFPGETLLPEMYEGAVQDIRQRRQSDFKLEDLMQEQNENLKQINDNTKPQVNRNANVE